MQASFSCPFVRLCQILTPTLIKPFCQIRREVWKFRRLGPAQNVPSLLVYAFQSKRKAFRRASELPASALQDDINFHILCLEKSLHSQATFIPVTTISGDGKLPIPQPKTGGMCWMFSFLPSRCCMHLGGLNQ